MPKLISQKALVYVVRNDRLLVHRHLDFSYEEVGIQVPAGTIRPGESPKEAAFRELREETGYDCFEIISELGITTYDMSPYREEIQERHFFLAKLTADVPGRWESREDHDSIESPTRLECFWIPLSQAHVLSAGQGAMLWKVNDAVK